MGSTSDPSEKVSEGSFFRPENLHPILCGIETEYGFTIEGRGAEDQIEDAIAFVQSYKDPHFVGWNYAHESPRADLRGFKVDQLAFDPIDAEFDEGKKHREAHEVRSDRILYNGSRFYNDHGHPEYSTPECWSLKEVGLHDSAGEMVLRKAAFELESILGKPVKVYKNNTDFHGASYGTHENYQVPRRINFEKLLPSILPMLVARQILTGAGKVGSEKSKKIRYQISSRADFFSETANVETLFRRPVFNTRDEPHADPSEWIRLHVISGDANMIPSCTTRKMGLIKIALSLAFVNESPEWKIESPAEAFQEVSQCEKREFRIKLSRNNWTTAYDILESYFDHYQQSPALRNLTLDPELLEIIAESRVLLDQIRKNDKRAGFKIDWIAKFHMLESFIEETGIKWDDPSLQSFDLEYHNIDPEEGLYFALAEMGQVEPASNGKACLERLLAPKERNRGWARSLAMTNFSENIITACWRSITFKTSDGNILQVELPPEKEYSPNLATATDVETFITWLTQ